MSPLSIQRLIIAVLALPVACMSAVAPTLMHRHLAAGLVWVGGMAILMVVIAVQYAKLRSEDD